MKKRILLLDNDRDFARTLASRLRAVGDGDEIAVDLAFNVVEATTSINVDPPLLIGLDVDLSHESGLAFCEYLAWNRELCTIPVVVMTRREDVESIRRSCPIELRFVDKSVGCWDTFLMKFLDLIQDVRPKRAASNTVSTCPLHRRELFHDPGSPTGFA